MRQWISSQVNQIVAVTAGRVTSRYGKEIGSDFLLSCSCDGVEALFTQKVLFDLNALRWRSLVKLCMEEKFEETIAL